MSHSRNPYRQAEQSPHLLRSVVAYMDVLGYKQMADHAEKVGNQNAFLAQLHEALSKGREWLQIEEMIPPVIGPYDFYAIRAFTDNIVIGWPIRQWRRDDGEVELDSAVSRLSAFQLEMANAGFFVRGGISMGDAYIDDIVVFGSGFLEAYDGESRLARDPRIVLTKSATAAVKKHLTDKQETEHSSENRDLYCDNDGQWFLNYLETILSAMDEAGPAYAELVRHKEVVERKLTEFRSDPSRWMKYLWVAKYHNYFCDQNAALFDESYKIDKSLIQEHPRRIVDSIDTAGEQIEYRGRIQRP